MIEKQNINDFGNVTKITGLMDQLSCHYVILLFIAIVCYDIF